MHVRFDPSVDAPGDQLRDELGEIIGKITGQLHAPYEAEALRLRLQRAEIAQKLLEAQGEQTELRARLGAAQGQRSTTLEQGDDASEHVLTSRRLSDEVEDV